MAEQAESVDVMPRNIPRDVPPKMAKFIDNTCWGKWMYDPDNTAYTGAQSSSAILFLYTDYKREGLTGKQLWVTLKDDFEGWTLQSFNKALAQIVEGFRNFLDEHGVYVERCADGERIGKTLVNVLQLEKYHVWTDQEIQEGIDRNSTFAKRCHDSDFIASIQPRRIMVRDLLCAHNQYEVDGKRPDTAALYGPRPPSTFILRNISQNAMDTCDTDQSRVQGNTDMEETPAPRQIIDVTDQSCAPDNTDVEGIPTPRQVTGLGKVYIDEVKRGGERYEVRGGKLSTLHFSFRQVGIPRKHSGGVHYSYRQVGTTREQFGGVFSIMLKGKALDYFQQQPYDPRKRIIFDDTMQKVKSTAASDVMVGRMGHARPAD